MFGGGIFTDNSTFELSGFSNFHGNQASCAGGGICTAGRVLKFDTSSVTANYTRDGSVVSLVGST